LSGLTAAFPNAEDASRRYNLILLGQNMYTPEDFRLFNPDPHDRPFAGWLYSGVGMMQDTKGTQRKWRFHDESAGGRGRDAIPQWDMRVGNVYDDLGAGGLLRFGRNLRADYGPPHIDLNTGADYINESR
jgi:hypothetical protein